MNVDVVSGIVIARPRVEVAAFATDPDNAPVWCDNVEGVKWKTEPPLTVGTKVVFTAQFLGRRMTYIYEVVTHDPGTLLVMRADEGPFPLETTYRWSSQDEGTAMTLRHQGKARGLSLLAAPMAAAAMKRASRQDLDRLKAILEAR